MANTKQFPIRLSDEHREALKRIMERNGFVDAATAIRWLIQQEDRRSGGVPVITPASNTAAPTHSDAEDLD